MEDDDFLTAVEVEERLEIEVLLVMVTPREERGKLFFFMYFLLPVM